MTTATIIIVPSTPREDTRIIRHHENDDYYPQYKVDGEWKYFYTYKGKTRTIASFGGNKGYSRSCNFLIAKEQNF